MKRELENLKEYFTSTSNEDAKRKYAYPYFVKLFGKYFENPKLCASTPLLEKEIVKENS